MTSGPRLRLAVPAALGLVVVALSAGALTPEAGSAADCANSLQAGSHPATLVVDRQLRTALVHVPPAAAAGRRLPLVLALHGVGGSGPKMETYSGLSAVADRQGFIVAYPSSRGSFWNSTASRRLPNDVRFLSRLITLLQQSLCVDQARVYATGVSNGGAMVALAGCELSDQIGGFASVAGGYDGQPPCRPIRPESVLEIHGTADQVVPYFGAQRRRTSDGLPPFVNGWVRRERCRPRATVTRPAPRTTVYTWSHCANGVRVEHIRIVGGRHAWPGATPPDPGPASTICGACTVWSFFSALRPSERR